MRCTITTRNPDRDPFVGKGSVQTIIPLGPGNGAIALITARSTPSGRSIQARASRLTSRYRRTCRRS